MVVSLGRSEDAGAAASPKTGETARRAVADTSSASFASVRAAVSRASPVSSARPLGLFGAAGMVDPEEIGTDPMGFERGLRL